MTYRISVIEGDGIGPHIVNLTKQLLNFLAERYNFTLQFLDSPAGDRVKEETGEALPSSSLKTIMSSDACLKGPVGETARDVIVFLRQKLDLFANIRPFKTYNGIKSKWNNVDFVIVRENTEDLYKSIEDVEDEHAVALLVITRKSTERIAKVAFNMAMQRKRKVTIVHKANVLRSYQFFRKVAYEVAEGFKEVKVEDMYVDNAAYQMIINPQNFDVILTPNLFGDILSDEAAGVAGTIGIAGSANIGENYGLFEPVHGSAPTLDPEMANPIAQITAAKMMLEWLGDKKNDKNLKQASYILWKAVENILNEGKVLTPDLGGNYKCSEFVNELRKEIEHLEK